MRETSGNTSKFRPNAKKIRNISDQVREHAKKKTEMRGNDEPQCQMMGQGFGL